MEFQRAVCQAPLFDAWPLEYQGTMMAFWRSAFAALVLLRTVCRPRWNVSLVALTLCFTAMTRSTAANAIWLQSTAP